MAASTGGSCDDKGLADFTDILSKRFTAPTDRIEYPAPVKDEQSGQTPAQAAERSSGLNADNINSKAVVALQEACPWWQTTSWMPSSSATAVWGSCARPWDWPSGARPFGKAHVYGALHAEPPFKGGSSDAGRWRRRIWRSCGAWEGSQN